MVKKPCFTAALSFSLAPNIHINARKQFITIILAHIFERATYIIHACNKHSVLLYLTDIISKYDGNLILPATKETAYSTSSKKKSLRLNLHGTFISIKNPQNNQEIQKKEKLSLVTYYCKILKKYSYFSSPLHFFLRISKGSGLCFLKRNTERNPFQINWRLYTNQRILPDMFLWSTP